MVLDACATPGDGGGAGVVDWALSLSHDEEMCLNSCGFGVLGSLVVFCLLDVARMSWMVVDEGEEEADSFELI